MKYPTAVFLKFFSQIKETLKTINNDPKATLNQTSNQAKAPSPLSAIIVPFWKRHKIDSYSVKERRKVQRKGECTDESSEDGPDYHHPEDDN
jgi:hypothetical protein